MVCVSLVVNGQVPRHNNEGHHPPLDRRRERWATNAFGPDSDFFDSENQLQQGG